MIAHMSILKVLVLVISNYLLSFFSSFFNVKKGMRVLTAKIYYERSS